VGVNKPSVHYQENRRDCLHLLIKELTHLKHGLDPSGRFKFVLKADTIDFNHTILIDMMYIDGSPILHIVDDATRFQAARSKVKEPQRPPHMAQGIWKGLIYLTVCRHT
jgi:hypothetical protein